jgi:putative tryptophan/tyrosine transport system substrate-binding protein
MAVTVTGLHLVVAAFMLAAPLTVEAQQVQKVYRIGYMSIPSSQSARDLIERVFLPALRERGLVEGKNLVIEWRWAEGKPERLPGFAAELVALDVDLIVAPQSDSALAAKRATRTIPIVHVLAGDPVADGLVASLAHPGGNVTGLTATPTPEIFGKSLELLKEATGASRVAVLWNPARNSPYIELGLLQLKAAARTLGVQLQVLEARDPDQFETAFAAMAQGRASALFMVSDSMFWQHRRRLAELEAKYRIPAMHELSEYVAAGGLMAYGVDLAELFRRAPVYIDKILKGAKPADLPVEQPTKFDLVINLTTAKALGLAIPQSLSLRADRLIE